MKEVILIALEKGKETNYLWAIDKETYCLVKLRIAKEKRICYALGDVIRIESGECTEMIPEIFDVSISDSEMNDESIMEILDIKSAYPGDESHDFSEGRILKVSEVKSLVNTANSVGMVCSVYGIPNKTFQANITDAKWVTYWSENRANFENVHNGIVQGLNKIQNKYFILDYRQNQFGTVINCCGMVIING